MKWATKNIQTVNFVILKSKKRQREKLVAVVTGQHFDKVEVWKVSSGCIDFRDKKFHKVNYLLTSRASISNRSCRTVLPLTTYSLNIVEITNLTLDLELAIATTGKGFFDSRCHEVTVTVRVLLLSVKRVVRLLLLVNCQPNFNEEIFSLIKVRRRR